MNEKMSLKDYASQLHTEYMRGYMNEGLSRLMASRKAYLMVGQDIKLMLGDIYEPIPDQIPEMNQEFQNNKRRIERDYSTKKASKKGKYTRMKGNWNDIKKKYGTRKEKSLKFSKERI